MRSQLLIYRKMIHLLSANSCFVYMCFVFIVWLHIQHEIEFESNDNSNQLKIMTMLCSATQITDAFIYHVLNEPEVHFSVKMAFIYKITLDTVQLISAEIHFDH